MWEYAIDEEGEEGQDETTVRPVDAKIPLDPGQGSFVVRALLMLADGTRLTGYLNPPFEEDLGLGTVQPVIVTDAGQVGFWWGMIEPSMRNIAESYQRLGRAASGQVFPVKYESAVALRCGQVAGEIPGFVFLEDWKTARTRVVG